MHEIEDLRYAFYRHYSELDNKLLDKIWEKLVSEGNVERALNDPAESALNVLLDDAKPIVDGAKMQKELSELPDFDDRLPGRQGKLEERQETPPRLDAFEQERAVAFEEHVARIAADDPLVRHYRDRVLDGQLLTAERAQSLVSTPASWFLSREMFDRLGVSVGEQVTGLVVEHDRPGVNHGHRANNLTLRVEPPGVEVTETRSLHLRPLEYISETDGRDLILMDTRSILGELAELVDKLAVAYPWPSKAEIASFVLTGAPPAVPPVRASHSQKVNPYPPTSPFGGFEYTTITVTAAHWVPLKDVEAAWREEKREVSGDHKYRRIEEKGLKMIRFIAGCNEPPKGHRLLEAWNNTEWVKKSPKWSYDEGKSGASSRFWKHYHSARRALAFTKRSEPGGG
jgi:hypothetical protein